MQVTAYEIGLTTEQFWRTRPVDFNRMVEGYQRRNRASGEYFRQTFALLYNINRGEKNPYMSPQEVLLLPGEKKPRQARKARGWTQEAMMEAARKHSNPTE